MLAPDLCLSMRQSQILPISAMLKDWQKKPRHLKLWNSSLYYQITNPVQKSSKVFNVSAKYLMTSVSPLETILQLEELEASLEDTGKKQASVSIAAIAHCRFSFEWSSLLTLAQNALSIYAHGEVKSSAHRIMAVLMKNSLSKLYTWSGKSKGNPRTFKANNRLVDVILSEYN